MISDITRNWPAEQSSKSGKRDSTNLRLEEEMRPFRPQYNKNQQRYKERSQRFEETCCH